MKFVIGKYPLVLVLVVALSVLTGSILGCDSTSSESSGILVEPPSAVIAGQGSVFFTAVVDTNRNLILPLEWSVDEAALGRISESAGLSAVYVSSGAQGASAITVRDQSGRDGLAVVNQTEAVDPNG